MYIQKLANPVAILMVVAFVAILAVSGSVFGAEYPQQSASAKQYASTTAYTITQNAPAIRVIATSTREATTAGRSALTLQPIYCSGSVWVQFNDVAATTTSGIEITASTTRTFGNDLPNVYGSVRVSSNATPCQVLVTEWRTEN